jgi:hypothetical protein
VIQWALTRDRMARVRILKRGYGTSMRLASQTMQLAISAPIVCLNDSRTVRVAVLLDLYDLSL